MNRINRLFDTKRSGILSVYFTAGYPNLEDTVPTLCELEAAGVDMAEIGIPFSDPMADGPVIQESGAASLRNGMSLRKLFSQLEGVRERISMPLVMMGYLNPVMQYGVENFCRDCARVGIDGVIIPDLPFGEYISYYKPLAERYGLRFVMLVTPETSPDRIRLIDGNTDGFIYVVSSASTTGARENFPPETEEYFRRVRDMGLKNPLMIGFGISNAATCGMAYKYAAGAITGSRFIKLLSGGRSVGDAVRELVASLRG